MDSYGGRGRIEGWVEEDDSRCGEDMRADRQSCILRRQLHLGRSDGLLRAGV